MHRILAFIGGMILCAAIDYVILREVQWLVNIALVLMVMLAYEWNIIKRGYKHEEE